MTTKTESHRSFKELTGLDTANPHWQIESLSDNGLFGYIVSTNERLGRIDPQILHELIPVDVQHEPFITEDNGTWGDYMFNLSALSREAADDNTDRDDIERMKTLAQGLAVQWLSHRPDTLFSLQRATMESFLCGSEKIDWNHDRRKLREFAEDVTLLHVAYQEMERREIT